MRWVAIFDEPPEMVEVRERFAADHFAYLRENQSEIIAAGGLRSGAGEPFTGGLWVLEVTTRERAAELVERDPYFVHSRRKYALMVWGKALPEIQAVL